MTEATDGTFLIMLILFTLVPATVIVGIAMLIKEIGKRQPDPVEDDKSNPGANQ